MLTVEEVREYSEVFLGGLPVGSNPPPHWCGEIEDVPSRSQARFLYVHNGRASKLRITCALPDGASFSDRETISDKEVRNTIDWERFVAWINCHDDLSVGNIVTVGEWAKFQAEHRDTCGRNGELDTINNRMNDLNRRLLI